MPAAPWGALASRLPCASRWGSHSSHLGRYQFRSPSSIIDAGSSTALTIVASIRIGGGEPDAELLQQDDRAGREDREDAHHHDRGARDDARGRLDAVRDCFLGREPAISGFADPADDEHVVVHREPEQDHEHEDGQERDDPSGVVEADQPLAPAVLEDEHEDAVRRGDGEQVEDDCLRRDHQRAERDEQQDEREDEHEREHQRRRLLSSPNARPCRSRSRPSRRTRRPRACRAWRGRSRCGGSSRRTRRRRRCRCRRAEW